MKNREKYKISLQSATRQCDVTDYYESKYCDEICIGCIGNFLQWLDEEAEPKEFTADELAIMQNVKKEIEWIARDKSGYIYFYPGKPYKSENSWQFQGKIYNSLFNDIFKSIRWEDEEPVCIDDYVDREPYRNQEEK